MMCHMGMKEKELHLESDFVSRMVQKVISIGTKTVLPLPCRHAAKKRRPE